MVELVFHDRKKVAHHWISYLSYVTISRFKVVISKVTLSLFLNYALKSKLTLPNTGLIHIINFINL